MLEISAMSQVPSRYESKIFKPTELPNRRSDVETSESDRANTLKWLLYKIFLFIIVAIFGYFTIKTSWALTTSYASSKTTFTQKTPFNQSVALPQSTVGFILFPTDLDNYWPHQASFLQIPPKKTNHYQTSLFYYFNSSSITKDAILNKKEKWPNALLYVAHYYLFLIQDFEGFFVQASIDNLRGLTNQYPDIVTAMNILEDKMKFFNISVQELRFKYGIDVKAIFNLSINYNDQEVSSTSIDIDRVSLISDASVSFNLPFDQHPLKNGDSIVIQAQRSELPNNFIDRMMISIGEIYEATDIARIYVDTDASFDNFIRTLPINIVSVYQAMSSVAGQQRCSETTSKALCESDCRREYFLAICGCVSGNGDRKDMFTANSCYLTNYMTCFEKEDLSNNEEAISKLIACENGCLDTCEKTVYSNPKNIYDEKGYGVASAVNGKYLATMKISIANYDYPIFEETWEMSFPVFFGTLGGALGLWLGINIFNLTIYISIAIKFLNRNRPGKVSNEPTNAGASSNRADNNDANNTGRERDVISVRQSESMAERSSSTLLAKLLKREESVNMSLLLLRIALGLISMIITGLTISEYLSQPIVVNLNVEFNDSMTLPNATICLPLDYGELDGRDSSTQQRYTLSSGLRRYLNMQNLKKDDFISMSDSWDNSVLNVVHAYLIDLSNCEGGIYMKCNKNSTKDQDLIAALKILNEIMLKLNITVEELRQRTGYQVSLLYSFQVKVSNLYGTDYPINISRTKFIGDQQICYEIPFNLYPLAASDEFLITLNETTLPNPRSFGFDRGRILIGFEDRLFVDISNTNEYYEAIFQRENNLPIELEKYKLLQSVNGGERRCGEQTVQQCEAICRIKYIQEQCKCIPTSWPNLLDYLNNPVPIDFCDLKRYAACPNITSPMNTQCISQCSRPCERYKILVKNQQTQTASVSMSTTISLFFSSMSAVVIEEQLTLSFEIVLRILGGIIGFVMGCSILDMVYFAYLLITGLFFCLLAQVQLKFVNDSHTHVIEVRPASRAGKDSEDNVHSTVVSAINSNKLTDILSKLTEMLNWLVNKLKKHQSFVLKWIAISIFCCLTVKMCIPIIQNYSANPTVSKMSLAFNKSVRLKPATLCIVLHPREFFIPRQSYEIYIYNFFKRVNITKEYFLGRMIWTNELRFVIHYYLSMLAIIESEKRDNVNLIYRSQNDASVPSFFDDGGEDIYKAFVHLEEHLRIQNISVDELRQRQGIEVAALFSLEVYHRTNCQGTSACRNQTKIPVREVISIDVSYTCYRVPFDQYGIRDPKEEFIVTANSNSLPNSLFWDGQREIIIYFLSSNTTVSYELASYKENTVTTYFNWNMIVRVALSAVYRSLRSLNRCSEFKTREICIFECRVELFRQMCNCSPTSWSSWAKSDIYEECKFRDYVNCVNYSGTEDIPCVKANCSSNMELCERWSYILTNDANAYNDGARIVIRVTNFDYPTFEEQYEFTFEEFTAAIGGAIGFYLGIDFFMIVRFVIDLISMSWKTIVHRL